MTRDGEDREQRLQFAAAPFAAQLSTLDPQSSASLLVTAKLVMLPQCRAQPLGLLDQLVNLFLFETM